MQRISVVGSSGAGKTTLALELSHRLGIPRVELDAIHHLPGWQPIEAGEFRRRVSEVVMESSWVIDGNYAGVHDLVRARADTIVWLDYSRWVTMRRLIPRTLFRAITRRELWNGNRERIGNVLSLDPAKSVIAWSWTRHHTYGTRYASLAGTLGDSVLLLRFRRPAETRRWLESL